MNKILFSKKLKKVSPSPSRSLVPTPLATRTPYNGQEEIIEPFVDTYLIVAIIIVSIILVGVIVFAVVFFCKRKRGTVYATNSPDDITGKNVKSMYSTTTPSLMTISNL